jgi:hypothetical protein
VHSTVGKLENMQFDTDNHHCSILSTGTSGYFLCTSHTSCNADLAVLGLHS